MASLKSSEVSYRLDVFRQNETVNFNRQQPDQYVVRNISS